MLPWQKAAQKFIESWKKRKDVIGAVVCGSYAVGTATKKSDIDIHIILSDNVKWRARGNKILDGFMIEYFVNPIKQIKFYQDEIYTDFRKNDARMFSTGIILFDKTGEVTKFKEYSKKRMKEKFKGLSKFEIELNKYILWDEMDNLSDLDSQKSPGFAMFYYNVLGTAIKTYARFLKTELPAPSKLHRFLTDPSFCSKYKIEKFPDKIFTKQFLAAAKKPNFKLIDQLVKHVFGQMGGFKVDGFKLKAKLKLI